GGMRILTTGRAGQQQARSGNAEGPALPGRSSADLAGGLPLLDGNHIPMIRSRLPEQPGPTVVTPVLPVVTPVLPVVAPVLAVVTPVVPAIAASAEQAGPTVVTPVLSVVAPVLDTADQSRPVAPLSEQR